MDYRYLSNLYIQLPEKYTPEIGMFFAHYFFVKT